MPKYFKMNSGLAWSCIASALLLVGFSVLHLAGSPITNLPVQWLWVSLIPILLALIVGGYVGKLKAAGIEFELDPLLRQVPYVPQKPGSTEVKSTEVFLGALHEEPFRFEKKTDESEFWQQARKAEYARTDQLSVVHAYQPSKSKGQSYDITIYLMRHIPGHGGNKITGLDDVEKAEFFFGPSWGNRVFVASNEGEVIGVRTSAWGTFLVMCRVTFRTPDKAPAILFRYVDFEMAPDRTDRST